MPDSWNVDSWCRLGCRVQIWNTVNGVLGSWVTWNTAWIQSRLRCDFIPVLRCMFFMDCNISFLIHHEIPYHSYLPTSPTNHFLHSHSHQQCNCPHKFSTSLPWDSFSFFLFFFIYHIHFPHAIPFILTLIINPNPPMNTRFLFRRYYKVAGHHRFLQ